MSIVSSVYPKTHNSLRVSLHPPAAACKKLTDADNR
jgi:hypothetical protein